MPFSRSLLAFTLTSLLLQDTVIAAPEPTSLYSASQADIKAGNAWVEINKTAFEHNIRTLQTVLADQSKLCAVLKADAYGHGIGLLAPSVIALGVPCVGVASNAEARALRDSGFSGQLVRVRTAGLHELEGALPYNLEELVGNLDFAMQASSVAQKHGMPLVVHLALNSGGMSRNGVDLTTAEGRHDAVAITRVSNLTVRGIMTHFPSEDSADVRKGLATFSKQADWLVREAQLDRSKITLHAANSFATLEVPESHLDMVRPGGALFGDTTRTEYQRVMQFKSTVASVNAYPKGSTVGYDRAYTLTRDSKLANVTVGYSDGYRRAFTEKGHVLINGHRAPVVGKVSMNTLMVDVTDIINVRGGDEVVLFGKQGDAEITQAEIEDVTGVLLAELYTSWGSSNPQVLVEQ